MIAVVVTICMVVIVTFLLRRWLRRKLTAKSVAVFLGIVALGAVGTIAQGWYYDQYVWPERIQKDLLGRAIARHAVLLHYQGFSHFGQGAFNWTYTVELSDEAIAEFCGSQVLVQCRFERKGKPAPNVQTFLIYERGTLLIEEDWL